VLHTDQKSNEIFYRLSPCSATAVVPLCLGLIGCDALPSVEERPSGSAGRPQRRACCVCAGRAHAVKPANPSKASPAVLVHQVGGEKALGSSAGACCDRGDGLGGRQRARTGCCVRRGIARSPQEREVSQADAGALRFRYP